MAEALAFRLGANRRGIVQEDQVSISTTRPVRQDAPEVFGLNPRQFSTQQFTQTLPVVWGRHYLRGFFLTPIFNERADAIKEKVKTGKKSQSIVTGYNYFGTYAMALHAGVIDSIEQIQYIENDLLSDPETPVDANTPLTIATDVGDMIFYPGGSTQPVDSVLGGLGTQPAYRDIAYIVFDNIAFGSQNSPPNVLFTIKRHPVQLTLSAHQVNGDAVLPEVIYDVMVNDRYGLGMDPSRIDKASFEAIGESLIAEGHGVSPILDGDQTAKQLISDLLLYSDLALGRDANHKITLNRIRDQIAKPIDPNAFLERLEKEVSQWSETWVETRLEYSDRTAKGDTRSVTYHDLAAEANSSRNTYKEFRRPFFTQAALAHQHASQIGRAGGVPQVTFKGVLNRSYSNLMPGEIVSFTYEGASKRVLLTDVEVGGPKDPQVTFTGILDRSYLKTRPVDVTDFIYTPATPNLDNATFRITTLPDALKSDAKDGLLVAASRANAQQNGGIVSFAFDLDGEWFELGQVTIFAMAAQINSWRHINAQYIALDVTFDSVDENAEFTQAVSRGNQRLLHVVSCFREVEASPAKDQHSVDPAISIIRPGSVPTPHPTDARRWLIDVETALFGTKPYRFLESGIDGRYPTTRCFIGVENAFLKLPLQNWQFERGNPNDPTDTELVRYIRLQTTTSNAVQTFSASPSIAYDRDLTTMNPSGTYTPDWNEASTPSHDSNLGKNAFGTDPFFTPGLAAFIQNFRVTGHPFNGLFNHSSVLTPGNLYTQR